MVPINKLAEYWQISQLKDIFAATQQWFATATKHVHMRSFALVPGSDHGESLGIQPKRRGGSGFHEIMLITVDRKLWLISLLRWEITEYALNSHGETRAPVNTSDKLIKLVPHAERRVLLNLGTICLNWQDFWFPCTSQKSSECKI